MKKHVLLLAAIVLLTLSVKANNLADQLCQDETFISVAVQMEEITACLKTLTADERAAYRATEAFTLQHEQLVQKLNYLSTTYNLRGVDALDKVFSVAAEKIVSKKVVSNDSCWEVASQMMNDCPSGEGWGACIARAWAFFDRCMAP